jgi:demethylmenaquinone methyltransferase/2-methoxy-6-polyprenyl-1,4-benzoquinol methylase
MAVSIPFPRQFGYGLAAMTRPDHSQGNETHFGFRTVPEGDKARLVRGVFDSVASRYDVMNDLMSGGIHRLWKAAMIDWLNPHGPITVLDVAGGTGDIAFRILDRAPQSRVIVADINAAMLEQGRDRYLDRGAIDQARLGRLTWACMDAETLALPDRSVDAYTIAFGIRNVTHIEAALAEAYRVLKPGGRFLCLEFSTVRNPALAKVYDIYSFNLLPKLGGIVANDAESYRYLVESIRRFPNQERFAAMIEAAGFRNVAMRDLTGGIAALHSARRI